MAELFYPIGIQTFSKLREENFVYVDKTMYIAKLIESNAQFVFLSRPRRFGKSLFLSTLHDYFSGRKELFEGLAIADLEHEWIKYPVLHLDLTGRNYSKPQSLGAQLNEALEQWEAIYDCPNTYRDYEERFRNVITHAYEATGQKVVILIDEYDKPLLETIHLPEQQEQFHDTLRSIYGNLKKMDRYIRFAMLTGVTKFGRLSIFSDLNNLQDISMSEEYAGICGITTDELHRYFHSGVEKLAKAEDISVDKAYEELRLNYDGYHFSPKNCPDIYNPFSLLNALSSSEIGSYWFETGTPLHLVKIIQKHRMPLKRFEALKVPVDAVRSVAMDVYSSIIPVLYQAGYLTIRDYDPKMKVITLDYPNREVEKGFLDYLMRIYVPSTTESSHFYIYEFYEDVCEGRVEEFMLRLQSFFTDFPYESFDMLKLEQHYQDVTFIVFKLLGFLTNVEYRTAAGRIDMVVKTPKFIYLFEFKLDKSPEEAMEQINSKDYLIPFRADGRTIIKIGANFTSASRGIGSWIIE